MKSFLAIGAALLAASCMADTPRELSADEEMSLADELGRYEQTGPAVSCVASRDLRGNRSVGEGAIIFSGPGRTIWVNRPPAGCPEIRSGLALQTRTPNTRLCRGDIATVIDPVAGTQYGGCGLGDFTPYRRRD